MPSKRKDSKNPQNPNNSTIVQGILDLKTISSHDSTVLQAADILHEHLLKNPQQAADVDSRVSGRQYNDHNVTYTRMPTMNACPVWLKLDKCEMVVMLFFAQTLCNTSTIMASIRDIADCTGLYKDAVSKAIQGLKRKGCITVLYQPTGNHAKPIYLINPAICATGKIRNEKSAMNQFQKYCPADAYSTFQDLMSECKWQVATENMTVPLLSQSDGTNEITSTPTKLRVAHVIPYDSAPATPTEQKKEQPDVPTSDRSKRSKRSKKDQTDPAKNPDQYSFDDLFSSGDYTTTQQEKSQEDDNGDGELPF